MERDAGNTQGFGRVSPVTRPSPYSPVQFRGGGSSAPARAVASKPSRARIVGRAAAVGAAIAAITGALAWFVIAPAPVPVEQKASAPPLPAPASGDERAAAPRVSTKVPQASGAPKS
jgi:hypothetical protein